MKGFGVQHFYFKLNCYIKLGALHCFVAELDED